MSYTTLLQLLSQRWPIIDLCVCLCLSLWCMIHTYEHVSMLALAHIQWMARAGWWVSASILLLWNQKLAVYLGGLAVQQAPRILHPPTLGLQAPIAMPRWVPGFELGFSCLHSHWASILPPSLNVKEKKKKSMWKSEIMQVPLPWHLLCTWIKQVDAKVISKPTSYMIVFFEISYTLKDNRITISTFIARGKVLQCIPFWVKKGAGVKNIS